MAEDRRRLPLAGQGPLSSGPEEAGGRGYGRRLRTPLQDELLEAGALPDPDELGRTMLRPDLAPEAGYGEGGPRPLDGPGGPGGSRVPSEPADAGTTKADRMRNRDPIPVLQWEVDPRDEGLPLGEARRDREGWDYRMWWQEHPSGLVYASVQALRLDPEEEAGSARAHPVGRSVIVNLVYDRDRRAIVAVYGTARDFRPFVTAFWDAYTDEAGDGGPRADGGGPAPVDDHRDTGTEAT